MTRHAPPANRCTQCGLKLPFEAGMDARCGACLREPEAPLDRAVAAVDYGFPWDGLISGFKFHQRLDLAGALAALLQRAVEASGSRPGLLLPVPLARGRLQERGYNQAWELARRVGRGLKLPGDPSVLLRIRETAHQVGLSHAERAGNLKGAFLVDPRHAQRIRGREVALVDDVSTSGATAREAARALKVAGASAVHLWVVARTP